MLRQDALPAHLLPMVPWSGVSGWFNSLEAVEFFFSWLETDIKYEGKKFFFFFVRNISF